MHSIERSRYPRLSRWQKLQQRVKNSGLHLAPFLSYGSPGHDARCLRRCSKQGPPCHFVGIVYVLPGKRNPASIRENLKEVVGMKRMVSLLHMVTGGSRAAVRHLNKTLRALRACFKKSSVKVPSTCHQNFGKSYVLERTALKACLASSTPSWPFFLP